jgi:hypothetical protein
VGFEEQERENREQAEDAQQVQSIGIVENTLQNEDAKLKAMMFTHNPSGRKHDRFFNDPLLRLSNFDQAANRRLRFYFMLLFKCDDFGKRAERFVDYFYDVIRAETDIYAATGEGRERVMQNTLRSVLERHSKDEQPRSGLGSMLDISRLRK